MPTQTKKNKETNKKKPFPFCAETQKHMSLASVYRFSSLENDKQSAALSFEHTGGEGRRGCVRGYFDEGHPLLQTIPRKQCLECEYSDYELAHDEVLAGLDF